MSLHYVIDGYNVIRSTEWLSAGSLDEQRARFVRLIADRRLAGSERNRVTVVFDGRPGRNPTLSTAIVRVVFSDDRDADSAIKDLIDGLSAPWEAVVVTNDREILRWVRGAKARTLSCSAFLGGGTKSPAVRRAEKPDAETARRINDELARRWHIR